MIICYIWLKRQSSSNQSLLKILINCVVVVLKTVLCRPLSRPRAKLRRLIFVRSLIYLRNFQSSEQSSVVAIIRPCAMAAIFILPSKCARYAWFYGFYLNFLRYIHVFVLNYVFLYIRLLLLLYKTDTRFHTGTIHSSWKRESWTSGSKQLFLVRSL